MFLPSSPSSLRNAPGMKPRAPVYLSYFATSSSTGTRMTGYRGNQRVNTIAVIKPVEISIPVATHYPSIQPPVTENRHRLRTFSRLSDSFELTTDEATRTPLVDLVNQPRHVNRSAIPRSLILDEIDLESVSCSEVAASERASAESARINKRHLPAWN